MPRSSSITTGLTLALFTFTARADGQRRPALNEFGNPARVAPAPTTGAITVRDLQVRPYQFADDSMQGRQVGRVGNMKGTAYIAAELKRLGLVPAGDNGSYFQVLPYHLRHFTNHSRLTVSGNPLRWEADWVAVPGPRAPRAITAADVVFGGVAGDTTRQIAASEAAGKFVVVLPAPASSAPAPRAGGRFAPPPPTRFADAVAVATVDLDQLSTEQRRALNVPTVATQSTTGRGRPGGPAAPTDSLTLLRQQLDQFAPQAALRLTREAAARLFGVRSVESLTPGSRGGTVSASLDYVELPSEFARNLAAIIPE